MSDLACTACCSVIYLAINDHTTTDATSQGYIQDNALSNACAILYFCQCSSIGIIINDARDIKPLLQVILQVEVVPAMCMMQSSYYTTTGIYQSAEIGRA